SEQSTVAIARLNVELEAHALVLGQPTVDLGRLPSARFLALARVVDLRCVDADVADLLDTVRETNMDRGAVDDADNQALERRGLSAGRTGDRGDEQEEREEPGAAPKSTHGPTLSWRRGHCPLLSTLRAMAGWRAFASCRCPLPAPTCVSSS